MKFERKVQNKGIYLYVVAITLVLILCGSIFLTYSWLKTSVTITNDINNADPIEDPITNLGEVDVEIYYNGSKVNREDVNPITITCSGSDATRTINLKVRNAGTIDTLVRATISIYYLDTSNNRVVYLLVPSPSAENQCTLTNSGWINNLAADNAVASGYMYYNSKLEPYTRHYVNNGSVATTTDTTKEISIISQVALASTFANKTFYMDVKIDACAYAGNIYKKIYNNTVTANDVPVWAYPFGPYENLPGYPFTGTAQASWWTAWQ